MQIFVNEGLSIFDCLAYAIFWTIADVYDRDEGSKKKNLRTYPKT